jgi:NADH-quinone oxidoreductase subunit F
MSVDLTFVTKCVERLGRKPEALIPILQALQDHYSYLPEEALRRVCETTEITPAALAGVSTFYDMFRHETAGKHIVRVCTGTACHVAGAERVEDSLRRNLHIEPGHDTDPGRQFTVEKVACLGCCTLAPVVKIGDHTFGHVTAEKSGNIIRDFLAATQDASSRSTEEHHEPGEASVTIEVGLGSCCMAKGSDHLFHALRDSAAECGASVHVKRVGCVGMCHRTPIIEVHDRNGHDHFYAALTPAKARAVIHRHFRPRGLLQRASRLVSNALDALMLDSDEHHEVASLSVSRNDPGVRAFLGRQIHIATEHFGRLDPLHLDEYLAHDGFKALARCLGVDLPDAGPAKPGAGSGTTSEPTGIPPELIVETIERSGLRGRGGAGFPTGQKWRLVRQQPGDEKFIICNGDEGDPGAFMDRMLLESFPFRIIEGLAIAAIATGAHEGVFYIRHEYPLAVRRVRAAIAQLEKRGWLGERLLGSGYRLHLSIMEGAGAFVCGEETALIASIEGRRGMPRLRPPFPAQSGLREKPTLINNVETLAMVPWILRNGSARFSGIGTARSKGTKVFALAGRVRRGGLIEVPMGTTIREIVEEIGGGVANGRTFKAVQIGGPSGGCVPARLADTPVDYESLSGVGAIMGSGGLVVLDDSTCMVDIARYFLKFTQEQSCGKCTFCRIGTRRMLDLLDRFCTGKARREHLEELETLAAQVGAGSLCGLGRTAPNPVLTTLRYFRDEYEAHLLGRCPAGKCTALINYRITADCTGCTICAQQCPVKAIPMTPYQRHNILQHLCTRCDTCRLVCPEKAVEVF